MKLSQEHFNLFKAECERWLGILSLKSWKIYYQFKVLDDSFGLSEWKYTGTVATISLATEFPKPFDNLEQQIKETALHECLEILLAPLTSLASDRTWDRLVFDKEVHSIIRVLEKIIPMANDKDYRKQARRLRKNKRRHGKNRVRTIGGSNVHSQDNPSIR